MTSLRRRSATVADSFLLIAAATAEAERLGHDTVDTDHLLLALLATDTAAGRLLVRRGVTLARAREAVLEIQRDDLGPLGIEHPSSDPGTPTRYAPQAKRLTPAAHRIMRTGLHDGNDLLEGLVALPDSAAARVLGHLGVDVPPTDTVTPDAPAVDSSREGWRSTCSVVVPVPRDRVWSLLDDPDRRASWDTDVHEVVVVDDEHFIGRSPLADDDSAMVRMLARGVEVDVHHFLTARSLGRVIQWRMVFPRKSHTEHLRIELEDAQGGTRLTLLHRDERGGGLGSRLLAWLTGNHLRLRAQAITQALS